MRKWVGRCVAVLCLSALVAGCGGGGGQGVAPISWWRAEGSAVDSVGGNSGTVYNGVSYAPGVNGQAFKFDTANGAIAIPDAESLEITGSLTIDTWVKITRLPTPAEGAGMIVFRGDSRAGLDAYALYVHNDGLLHFTIDSDANVRAAVTSTVPIGRFVRVTATLDAATGAMRLYEDGMLAAQTITTVRPLRDLDATASPGIGIGNHSGYPNTGYNYPFQGLIDEVKIYNAVVPP